MIFHFVVRRLRWLGQVPLLPQLFDAWLLLVTALSDRSKLRAIELLEKGATEIFGAEVRVHRYGGTGFVIGETELGHVHGNGLVDLFVGRTFRGEVLQSKKALPHHVFPRSGWVSFWIKDEGDLTVAFDLLRMANQRRESEAEKILAHDLEARR
jgi:hypothetical protein